MAEKDRQSQRQTEAETVTDRQRNIWITRETKKKIKRHTNEILENGHALGLQVDRKANKQI